VAFPRSGVRLADNGPVNARLVRFAASSTVALFGVAAAGGCTTDPAGPPNQTRSGVPVAGAVLEPRADLARRAAAGKDRRFVAAYTWTGGGAQRTVTVTIAVDGTWRVDVPGGALGGQAHVTLVGRPEAVYQCSTAGCSRIARAAGDVPAAYDPKVQHAFTDWPAVLTDRTAPISVAPAKPVPGAAGGCFSVEPTAVALAPPIEAGIFCYDDSGLPTAVVGRFGTLVLAGAPAPAPPTATLPGPPSAGPPLGLAAPPPPPSTAPPAPPPPPTTKPSPSRSRRP